MRGISDVRDQWVATPAFSKERDWLLSRLRAYEEGGRRRAVILAGDVHLATAVHASDRTGRALWQVTSSPLANRLPALVYPALTLLGRTFPATAGSEALRVQIARRWHGCNVGVVVGRVEGALVDLTFELYRPDQRTDAVKLDARLITA